MNTKLKPFIFLGGIKREKTTKTKKKNSKNTLDSQHFMKLIKDNPLIILKYLEPEKDCVVIIVLVLLIVMPSKH